MKNELLAELSEEELIPPEYYPIEYALMWVAHGYEPINIDYAKIIYDKPPRFNSPHIEHAERKLLTYLRSGKISAKTMGYKQNKEGDYIKTGRYETLDREVWKGRFNWLSFILSYSDDKGIYYQCTDIILNTKELLKCLPVDIHNKKQTDKNNFISQPYIPPYMSLMLQAVESFNLKPETRINKESIIDWLNKNWPYDLEGKSERLIKTMATLIRRPEDKKGGNTPWK